MTKSQKPNNTLRRVLTTEEKLEFVKTSVSWISSQDIMDTCFILNFGYEAPLPWPQVNISLMYVLINFNKQVWMKSQEIGEGLRLVPETHSMDVPSACTIVIIAGKLYLTTNR